MANRKIEFTEEQKKEIEEARKKNKDKNAERRLTAVYMKMQGKCTDNIVSRTGYTAVQL